MNYSGLFTQARSTKTSSRPNRPNQPSYKGLPEVWGVWGGPSFHLFRVLYYIFREATNLSVFFSNIYWRIRGYMTIFILGSTILVLSLNENQCNSRHCVKIWLHVIYRMWLSPTNFFCCSSCPLVSAVSGEPRWLYHILLQNRETPCKTALLGTALLNPWMIKSIKPWLGRTGLGPPGRRLVLL
jgi:hypothetical protein